MNNHCYIQNEWSYVNLSAYSKTSLLEFSTTIPALFNVHGDDDESRPQLKGTY